MSDKFRFSYKGKYLKAFGTKVCEVKNNVVELSSFVSILVICTMMIQLLDNLLRAVKRFRYISVSDASVHKQFPFHFKKAYRGSSRSRLTCVQKTFMSMGRQRRGERPKMSTKVQSM